MKIEKISEKQIRCTLNRDDLIDRELRISELAYGSEKAKNLFREAEDLPLMIEAIPVSSECLILVITKVEDPDELDTRFSKFSPSDEDDIEDDYDTEDDAEENSFADEVNTYFKQLDHLLDNVMNVSKDEEDFVPLADTLANKENEKQESDSKKSVSYQTNLLKVYSFSSLNEVIQLSSIITPYYRGENTLYKDPVAGIYYLVISKSEHTPEDFNKICNIVSEYGKAERTTYASIDYYREHFEVIVKDNAIQILSVM